MRPSTSTHFLAALALLVGAIRVPLRAQSTPAEQDLAELLEPIRKKFDVPALGAAIVQDDRVIAIGAVGVRARGSEEKVTVDDLWHLGSCTKAMTATLAAKLVEQGKLQWTTTVGETFPEWKDTLKEEWRSVQLQWLLQNRGGAPGNPPGELWSQLWGRTDSPHEARTWFVRELLSRGPEVQPGTKFVYSNQGFTIAGAMLEKVTGKVWEDLIRAELFEPLGMKSAGFGAPGSPEKIDQPRGHAPDPVVPGRGADNPPAIGPAGTVHCSLRDWAKFVAAHMRGENGIDSIVSASTFRKLHAPPEGQDYAMGWGRTTRPWGGEVLTHSGSNTMWFCVVWIAPRKNHAFLVTCNIAGESGGKAADAAASAMIQRCNLK